MVVKAAARRKRDEAASAPLSRRHLYLERASLIDIAERPVIVVSRPLPGEQTQIIRRPVKSARGRRWIFIFGGAAAMASLLAVWLGFSHRAHIAAPALTAPADERLADVRPTTVPVTVPMVAPVIATAATPAQPIVAPVAVAPVARVTAALASGRHSNKKTSARLASSSRLAAHRAPARPAATPVRATVAWVDPFVDR